jgi:phosphoribosylanthranilate isomerase
MALKTKVLVENITNLSEARYCAGMGVQLLAFPSQIVDPKMYQDITSWVQGPEMALDVSTCTEIPSDLNDYDCDYILISQDQLQSIPTETSPLIVRLKSNGHDHSLLLEAQARISYVIAEGLAMTKIKDLISHRFSILALLDGNETTNFDELLEWAEGVVLSGSSEAKPGLKDYDHLSMVLEKLEISED